MPIFAKASGGGGNYAPASPGLHAAVCVDVVDMGMQENDYTPGKLQHKIRIVWQIDEDRKDGKPFEVSKWYTLSLHEKASLRADLESWRGRAFNEQELDGFDVEKLLSVPAYLNLIHKEGKQGKTYANISAVMKPPKNMEVLSIRDYVRVCERQPAEAEPVPSNDREIIDDDIPF